MVNGSVTFTSEHSFQGGAMKLEVSQPPGYQEGAYRVEARLEDDELQDYGVIPIAFEIPTMSARFIHTKPPYIVAVSDIHGTKIRGTFVDGKWECHVYSNGVHEKDNPTRIEEVQSRIEASIASALDKIKHISKIR